MNLIRAAGVVFWALSAAVTVGEPPPIALNAKAVLKTHCYRCHGEAGAAEGGLNFVLDCERLVKSGVVKPAAAQESLLYSRVESGEMPADDLTKPTDEELAMLKQWINSGAPDFNEPLPARPFISSDQVAQHMVDDLLQQAPRARSYLRYLTITHLYNAQCPEDELQTYRNAITKLLNSVSMGRTIYVPPTVDPARTVMRVDLRALGWGLTEWNLVCLGTNPLCLAPNSPIKQQAAKLTNCNVYSLFGDRFVHRVSRPPLYHHVMVNVTTAQELEEYLGVNSANNYLLECYLRAGFNGSGVSKNNRLIERHESHFGGYWKSFDFRKGTGASNLFARPFGPGQKTNDFVHDGGEIIFSLPNGLQGYLLVDNQGNRIDVGPIDIVSDPSRPDRSVTNGISCMGCHAQGLIRKADQIRAHVEGNQQAFSKAELFAVQAVYRPDALEAALKEDRDRFHRAIKECGIPYSKTEPILALVSKYEEDLDERALAADFEITPTELRNQLAENPEIARAFGPVLVPGGKVKRDLLEDDVATGKLYTALGYKSLLTPTAALLVKGETEAAEEGSVYDFAMLLDFDAVTRSVSLDTLKERGYALEIETLPEPKFGDNQLAAWIEADTAGRNELLFEYAKKERATRGAAAYVVIVGQPYGSYHYAIASDPAKLDPDEVQLVMQTFGPPFRNLQFNTAVAELIRIVDQISQSK